MAFRRPELAGLAAPALLLLGAGRATRGGLPGRLTVRVGLTSTRINEGEPAAVDVVVSGADEDGTALAGAPSAAEAAGAASAGIDARWAFEPGRGIEPGSATAANGEAARFTFAIDRWGKRKLGTVTLTLHDRWRLAEGRVALALPAIDCYPSPAVQRTEVVLSKLPNRLGEHRARVPGDGTEFTGVREYVPGDRQRAINWPASTRLAASRSTRSRPSARRTWCCWWTRPRTSASPASPRSTSGCAARPAPPGPTWPPGTGWA